MDLIDRLHARLTTEVEREPDGRAAPLTVGDVYQRLVPYRAIRGEMGIMELAQYEDALLRLLAGERGYVRVDDEAAREELQRELASTNPILGVYRDYAGAPLTLLRPGGSGAPVPSGPAGRPSPPDATEEAPGPGRPTLDHTAEAYPVAAQHAGSRPGARAASEPAPPAIPARPATEGRAGAGGPSVSSPGAAAAGPCRRCGEPLPDEEDVRFCPACGEDQREVPCDRCGSRLRDEWRFCIRCGAPRRGVAPRS